MKPITLKDRLRYRFDLTMARGPASLIAWLFALTAFFVLAAAAVLVLANLLPKPDDPKPDENSEVGFAGAVWLALMRALDAGNVAGDSGSHAYLAVMFVTTLGGV